MTLFCMQSLGREIKIVCDAVKEGDWREEEGSFQRVTMLEVDGGGGYSGR